jgi:glycerol-3-phosphate dehydrogenase (NAD(P)+)
MCNILVVGSGLFASALINVLLKNKHRVYVYGKNLTEINLLKNKNTVFNAPLITNVNLATTNLNELIKIKFDYVLLAIPGMYINETIQEISAAFKNKNLIFISTAKGFNEIKNYSLTTIVYLLGPSFAKEVFNFELTSINVVCTNQKNALGVKQLFVNSSIICECLANPNSANLLSNLKNIGAILMGIIYSLTPSINTRAIFFTKLLNEINTFLKLKKLPQDYLLKYCGIGDIYLTCLHDSSRNFQFGFSMGQIGYNQTLKKYNNATIEGINNLLSFKSFIQKNKKLLPILSILLTLVNSNKIPTIASIIK